MLSDNDCFALFRRNLDYQEVLDALSSKGIAIRVASPKLVMEEVCICRLGDLFAIYGNSTLTMAP